MDSEIKELLRKNLEISERTLQLTQKMHRGILWGRFFGILKWAIVIGGVIWGYLALQPYLQQFLGLSNQTQGSGYLDILKNFQK